MATNSHIQFGGARRRTLQTLALVFAAAVVGAGHSKALPVYGFDEDDGRDTATQSSDKPTVEAAFPLESYAPFVLRPKHLGVNRVAVVMPTQTWQAYNHRDDNGDGRADTWYACACQHSARLGRPFL